MHARNFHPIGVLQPQSSLLKRNSPFVNLHDTPLPALHTHNVVINERKKPCLGDPRSCYRSFSCSGLRNHLNSQKISLDVNSLGKPGQIVVVPHRARRQKQILIEGKQPTIDSSAILDQLERQQGATDTTEFWDNLKALRSKYQPEKKLDDEEWLELRQHIEQSFTSSQLLQYISEFEKLDTTQHCRDQRPNCSTWKPGKSPCLGNNSASRERVSSRIAGGRKLRGKNLLAERILRDCWQLGIAEEVGQLDISLPPQAITLLLMSDHCSFETLARSYGVKIDVTRALELVRITGTKSSCESVAEIIESLASKICQNEADLPSFPRIRGGNNRNLASQFSEWLGTNYGVVCEKTSGRSRVKIHFFAEDRSRADNARRDLDLAKQYEAITRIPFCTYVPSGEDAKIYSVNTETTASWSDRNKQWFRWAMPHTNYDESGKPTTPLFDRHDDSRLSSDLLRLLRGTLKANAAFPIGGRIRETITATAGKSLFLQKPDVYDRALSASRLGELLLSRIFTGDIPKIRPFLRTLTPFPGSESRQLHRIRLTPSSMNVGTLPPLELEIEAKLVDIYSHAPSLVLRGAKVLLLEKKIDYLLPESDLDLRFARTIYQDIFDGINNCTSVNGNTSISNEDKPLIIALRGFLDSINPTYGTSKSHVIWPAFCHLKLPRQIFTPNSMQHMPGIKLSKATEVTDKGTDYITAEYMLPPLQSFAGSRTHLYDFHGERLSYGYHDCGPFFAKHTECVALDMNLICGNVTHSGGVLRPPVDTLQQEFNSFYRTACKMAFELGRTSK